MPCCGLTISEPLMKPTKAGGLSPKSTPLPNNELSCNLPYLAQPVKMILADKRCHLRRSISAALWSIRRAALGTHGPITRLPLSGVQQLLPLLERGLPGEPLALGFESHGQRDATRYGADLCKRR